MTDEGRETILAERRRTTAARLDRLRDHLTRENTEALLGNAACIYATGSVGRGETSEHSDLDVFIVASTGDTAPAGAPIDSAGIVDRLSTAALAENFPPFSKGGQFLRVHPLSDLIGHLGTSDDDHTNVLTARLLLLLESRPVMGTAVYEQVIESVIRTYWKDFAGNEGRFVPVFLTNDITRFWKVLCLSYEAHGDDTLGERRVRNYKLKNSRLLTCYSAILYLAWVLRARGTVTPDDAIAMARLTPTERLQVIGRDSVFAPQAWQLLRMYAKFLFAVDVEKQELQLRFASHEYHTARREEARQFGDAIFRLLVQLAAESSLLRYLLV
jgi:predicted nucleotidyltransferase